MSKNFKNMLCLAMALSILFSLAACTAVPPKESLPEEASISAEHVSESAENSDASVATEYEEAEDTETSEVTEAPTEETAATEETEFSEETEAPTEKAEETEETKATEAPEVEATEAPTQSPNGDASQAQPSETTPLTTEPPATDPVETVPSATEVGHEHSYKKVKTYATCTEAGYTTYTCKCGHSYTSDETPATGHSLFNSWHVTKEPTTDSEGEQVRYCRTCGIAGEIQVIPKLTESDPSNEVLDVGALMAYGNSYAVSIGFGSGGNPMSYYPASTSTFTTMAAAKGQIAGKIAGLKESLLNAWGSIENVSVNVVVEDLGNGSFKTTVYYG